MTTETLPAGIGEEWANLIFSRPLSEWDDVLDDDLPIPGDFVAIRAYYLYERRGKAHGEDVRDWLKAKSDMNQLFRKFVLSLSEQSWSISNGSFGQTATKPVFPPIKATLGQPNAISADDGSGYACSAGRRVDKIGSMRKMKKIQKMSPEDPRARRGLEELRSFQDHVGRLTAAERQKYRGKVLAVHCESGEIIAAANDVDSLRAAVDESKHKGCNWRLVDGPTGIAPIPLSDLVEDRSAGHKL